MVACPYENPPIDPFVATTFTLAHMVGTYYELAYHDYTEPRVCGCERTVKTLSSDGLLHDEFSMLCFGKSYVTPLTFTPTPTPGLLNGSCAFFEKPFGTTVCPDYVVDVGTRDPDADYPWVIEFQCVEDRHGTMVYAGMNFYSRSIDNDTLTAMLASAQAHGLQPYIDGGHPAGLRIVNHTDCAYPTT